MVTVSVPVPSSFHFLVTKRSDVLHLAKAAPIELKLSLRWCGKISTMLLLFGLLLCKRWFFVTDRFPAEKTRRLFL